MLPHALHNLPFVERFYSFPILESTNTYAKTLNRYPGSGIYVLQADRQSAGRGRLDNAFFSDVAGGLWASILVPVKDITSHFTHNRALSIALCESVCTMYPGAPVSIKWPNDIYWGNRKLCGILLETTPAQPRILIMGFGLNVNISREEFPADIAAIATSILIETGKRHSLTQLLRQVIATYHEISEAPCEQTHQRYEKYLYGKGLMVEVGALRGTMQGVDSNGILILTLTTGETASVHSGSLKFTTGDTST
jgi:BirA family transcriptional regulator, biotin operon repressor / biotin---[acetyl-CoA-carboxylase] ligase